MSIFKKRKEPKTRIVKRPEPAMSPLRAAVTSGMNTINRFDIRRDEFRGFDSPPGRF